jgi:hypothetical protein
MDKALRPLAAALAPLADPTEPRAEIIVVCHQSNPFVEMAGKSAKKGKESCR